MIKKKQILIFLLIIFLNITFLKSQINLINPESNSTILAGKLIHFEWENLSGNPVDIYYYNIQLQEWTIIAFDIEENFYDWISPTDLYGNVKFKIVTKSYSKPELLWWQENAHNGEIRESVFSDDGKYLATVGADKRVVVWNIENRQIEDEILIDEVSNVRSVKFYDNENALFFCADNKIFVWDRENDIIEVMYEDAIQDSFYYYIDVDKKNSLIAAANNEFHLVVCALSTYQTVFDVPFHSERVYAVKFSENSNYLAYSRDNGFINLIDMQKQEIIGEFGKHGDGNTNGTIWSIDFIAENKFASCGVDKKIKLWEFGKPNETHTFDGHEGHIRSLKYSKNLNTILSGSLDSTIRQWDLLRLKPIKPVTLNHGGQVLSVGYSPTGDTLLSAGRDKSFKLWKNFKTTSDSLEFSLNFKVEAKIVIPNYIYGVVGQIFNIPLELIISTSALESEKFKAIFTVEIPKLLVEPLENATKKIPLDTLEFTFEANYKNGDIFHFPVLALQSYYYFDSVRIVNFEIIENNILEFEKENGSVILATECMGESLRSVIITGNDKMIVLKSNVINDELNFQVNFVESANYRIELLNAEGQSIKLLKDEFVLNGKREYVESLADLSNGIYFLCVKWKNKVNLKKILLIR